MATRTVRCVARTEQHTCENEYVCVCLSVRIRTDVEIEGNRVDVRGDQDREAIAEFAILPIALIRREIRSSMVKQLASSPDHMKPSTPPSFSFLPWVYPSSNPSILYPIFPCDLDSVLLCSISVGQGIGFGG